MSIDQLVLRAVAASSDAAGIQPDEGGSQPTLPLHLFDYRPDFSAPRYRIVCVNGTTAREWYRKYHYLGDPSTAADHWAWVYSYADTGQGHHGGIYQAIGAVYVGMSPAGSGWRHTDGSMLHPRTAVSIFGSQSIATMTSRGYTRAVGAIAAKHVYIIPVGPRAGEIRAVLRHYTLPYPKRSAV